MPQTFIIAEAGTIHGGRPETAFMLALAAKEAGADAVKFQIFKPDEIVSEGDDLWDFFHQVQLPTKTWIELEKYCQRLGIEFMASVFGPWSLELYARLDGKHWKIASRSQYDWDLIEHAHKIRQGQLLISTGMNTAALKEYVHELAARGICGSDVTLMHCVSKYPTPAEDANLMRIREIAELGGYIDCGYSDHTQGMDACMAAVALGATWIEKHIKLPFTEDHPDASCSLESYEFGVMVNRIRRLERMLT